MNYPAKPWSDGQTFEVVPGETFQYDATTSAWVHVTKATLDSDYQVDKAVLQGDISTNASNISTLQSDMTTAQGDITTLQSDMSTAQSDITTLQSQVSALDLMSDSDRLTIEANIASINSLLSNVDSDTLVLQSLQTQIDAINTAAGVDVADHDSDVLALNGKITTNTSNISTNSSNITTLQSDMTTAQSDITSNTNAINALAMPVISATQPTGVTGQLWINTNDGKLYYWNDSDAFITIVTT